MRELWQHFDYGMNEMQFEECGIQQFEPRQVYQYTVYQPYIIHWVASGRGYFEIDQNHHTLEANDGFILRRGQQVKYYADADTPWRNYWIGFSGALLEEALSHTVLANQSHFHFQPSGQCQQIIQDICHFALANGDDDRAFYWYMMQVYRFIFHARHELASIIEPQHHATHSTAEIAAAYIYANYSRALTVEEVAQYIGLSRSALFRLFRQHFGVSPKQFLMETRLRQARQLLVESHDSIKTIAASVGYHDQLVFSKQFRKTFGMSPSTYREQAREPDFVGTDTAD